MKRLVAALTLGAICNPINASTGPTDPEITGRIAGICLALDEELGNLGKPSWKAIDNSLLKAAKVSAKIYKTKNWSTDQMTFYWQGVYTGYGSGVLASSRSTFEQRRLNEQEKRAEFVKMWNGICTRYQGKTKK